jgi:hypothetical protein
VCTLPKGRWRAQAQSGRDLPAERLSGPCWALPQVLRDQGYIFMKAGTVTLGGLDHMCWVVW